MVRASGVARGLRASGLGGKVRGIRVSTVLFGLGLG